MKSLFIILATLLLTTTAQADLSKRLQEIIEEKCALCHGEKGEASNSIYPRLAGQHVTYLKKQLRNFRDGVRKSDTMSEMAAELKDDEIDALAAHFSAQSKLSHRISSPKKRLAAVGEYIFHKGNKYAQIPACSSCHGKTGEGSETLPRLAGQHKNYVASQLKAFHERVRTNDNAIMHAIAKNLTELEVVAVSLYVSGLKPEQK